LVTAAILALLLYRYPISEIVERMQSGRVLPLLPLALLAGAFSLLLLSGADALLFGCLGRANLGAVLRARAASSMLQLIGYHLSSGVYGLWLARAAGASLRTAVGLIFYVMLNDLTALCVVGALAIGLGGEALLGRETQILLTAIASLGGGGLIALALAGPRLLPRWVPKPELLEPWARVPPRTFVANLCARIGNVIVAMAANIIAARAFGLDIPLGAMLVCLPAIFLIGGLPINVAGLGAVQGAWVVCFRFWADGTQLLAFQFLFQSMTMATLVLRGAPFLRGFLRSLESVSSIRSSASPDSAAAPLEADVTRPAPM
jgi:hypothetical protein